jgi:hypothetical protein
MKKIFLTLFNSNFGIFWYTFIKQDYGKATFKLATLLCLEAIIDKLENIVFPRVQFNRALTQHKKRMEYHFMTYSEDYKSQADQSEHDFAQKQLMLAQMPPSLMGKYMEIAKLYVWMMCFGVFFPASPFFVLVILVLAAFIQMTQMNEYQRRDSPEVVLDIGIWTDLFNYVNHLSFVSLTAAQVVASNNTK